MKNINSLTIEQEERYLRQTLIPEISEQGQIKLLNSSVLVIGAGGLGSAQCLYLAAAGIGRLGIVDFDRVSLSNFNRQILYDEIDIGILKSEAALHHLYAKNTDLEIKTFNIRLNEENTQSIIREFDVVLDATDNLETRYIINRACFDLKKPWIFGGIRHFTGQTALFDFRNEECSCLNCIFPQDLSQKNPYIPAVEKGVIGFVPGIIGLFQVSYTIKIILGIGNLKSGYLITENFLEHTRQEVKIPKDFDCVVCGKK